MPDKREDILDADKEQTVMLPMSVLRALLDLVAGPSVIESPAPSYEDMSAYQRMLGVREADLDRRSGMDQMKPSADTDKTIEDLLGAESYRQLLEEEG
tara:strand:+ start:399 stop:692 length:294 start_codon:yes stop_codon:yes gene_type:complete